MENTGRRKLVDETFMYMSEYHAINPNEMTTTMMNLKIKEQMHMHSHSDCLSRLNFTVH